MGVGPGGDVVDVVASAAKSLGLDMNGSGIMGAGFEAVEKSAGAIDVDVGADLGVDVESTPVKEENREMAGNDSVSANQAEDEKQELQQGTVMNESLKDKEKESDSGK